MARRRSGSAARPLESRSWEVFVAADDAPVEFILHMEGSVLITAFDERPTPTRPAARPRAGPRQAQPHGVTGPARPPAPWRCLSPPKMGPATTDFTNKAFIEEMPASFGLDDDEE